jgi:hypothetical protein
MVAFTFEKACARYGRFLNENGHSSALLWVTSQDILFTDRRLLYVKLPLPESNLKLVRELFDTAMAQQSGISFSTVCRLDEATCCRAWAPANEEEASRAMCPRDLKMSAHAESSRFVGEAVRNRLRWRYLHIRYPQREASIGDFFWG